jgi:outer membrane protein assembly factor BamB
VRTVAATICWGLAAWIGSTLPQSPPSSGSRGKPVPPPHFAAGWTITLDSAERVALSAGAKNFFVSSAHGPLVARSLEDGQQVWSVDIGSDVRAAASDDLIFVAHDKELVAIEQATGHKRWTTAIDPLAVALTYRDGWLFGATKSGSIVALRADTGSLVWEQKLETVVASPMAVDGDGLFAALADKRLIGLRITDNGTVQWSTDELDGVGGEPLTVADRLYVGQTGGLLFAFRQASGARVWVHSLIRARLVGAPVADESHVYIATGDNRAIALDRGSGTILWKNTLLSRPGESIMIDSRELIVPLMSGAITIFSADGKQVANLDAPAAEGVAMVPPVVLAGPPGQALLLRVTMGSDQVQTVTSFKRKTG